jgi:hypothetical protein
LDPIPDPTGEHRGATVHVMAPAWAREASSSRYGRVVGPSSRSAVTS